MKPSILLALALLLPITANAGQQCEKDTKGNVSCTHTTEKAYSQPGAVRETPSNPDSPKAREKGKQREQELEEQGVGSETSQSMEPGITY